ncbi:MAG: hypothetical protein EBR28_09585 [Planctomycetia bacterium]|nr:hypothetical protein [Planctomycetia bacterium]
MKPSTRFRLRIGAALAAALLAGPPPQAARPDRGLDVAPATVATFAERNGSIFADWPDPRALIVVTGELDGYIEPCGCTGKENQKGGLSRRQNFLRAVTAAGWPLVAVDLGGQVRRFGRQSEVKFQSIADGLKSMGYAAVGFGPGDLRLPAEEIVAAAAPVGDRPTPFVSANVGLLGLDANITPRLRVIDAGGLRIGITSVLGDKQAAGITNDAVEVQPATQALESVAAELRKADCAHQILLAWAEPEEARALAARFPQFDIVVTAGGGDEPPATLPVLADGRTRLVELGHKGMFAVAIGVFADSKAPLRSQRVPLDARFGESPDMIRLLATYQRQLESLGLAGLGIAPIRHPTGRRFAGSAACADCHQEAYDVWKESSHAKALTTLEQQAPRRDGDPECLSCHVVGWAPQRYEPFEGGFASMTTTPHLAHQGCENCHGPAAAHAAVERGDVRASATERDRLRQELVLSLDTPEGKQKAVNNCLECHDLDNSPQFDFDEYWPQVEHSETKTAAAGQ